MRYKVAGIVRREYSGKPEILLVKSRKNGKQWSLPGGQKKLHETNNEETLRRELFEETTLRLEGYRSYIEFQYFSPGKGPSTLAAYAVDVEGTPTPSGEIEGVAWVNRDRLKHYPLSTSMKEILPLMLRDGIL